MTVLKVIACHLIGDYVLQSDFIAKTKGENLYHLFVHCFLYCVPFALCFGVDMRLAVIFVSHVIIDRLKTEGELGYATDQLQHYLVGLIYLA